MSELKTQSETPRWVSDLNAPPPYKSKAAGIPDPPGFPSQASGSSKVWEQHTSAAVYELA